jgi:type II secretory pathway pseudopilin PulG
MNRHTYFYKKNKNQSGNFKLKYFTLVELLVVISILTLLMMLLFPSFKSFHYRANNLQCINNLKDLTNAYTLYADDNYDFYPDLVQDDSYGRTGFTYIGKNYWDAKNAKAILFDMRPMINPYLPAYGKTLNCPLSSPLWQEGAGVYDIENTAIWLNHNTYHIYPTANPEVREALTTEQMTRVGDTLTFENGSAAGVSYDLLASDVLWLFLFGTPYPMYLSTQQPYFEDCGELSSVINFTTGWAIPRYEMTTANFARSDGSVKSYPHFNYGSVENGEFLYTRYKNVKRGIFIPADLAVK